MKSNRRGYTLLEVMVVLSLFVALMASLQFSRPNTSKVTVMGLAEELAGEFERAHQRALSKQIPVALVFPSSGVGSYTRSVYLLEGEVSPKIVDQKSWELEMYQKNAILNAHWSLEGSGENNQAGPSTFNLPSDSFDFAAWDSPQPDNCHFVFMPSGEVNSNHAVSFDGAYHVVVADGYQGSPGTVDGVASLRLSETGPAATISISKLGAVSVTRGLVRGNSLCRSESIALSGPAAVLPTPATVSNTAPVILSLGISPEPNPATLSPLVDATVDLEGHLTLTLEAEEPNGDVLKAKLFAEHDSGPGLKAGNSSSSQDIRMAWNGSVWKGEVHWQVPDDAEVGSRYKVFCEVEDPDGLKDQENIGVGGIVEVLAPGKILFQTNSGAISVMNDDGTEVAPILKSVEMWSGAAKLSPERSRIAFQGGGGGGHFPWGIYVVNLDGTDLRRLTPIMGPEFEFLSPHWSGDGLTIYAYQKRSPDVDFTLLRLDPEGVTPPQVFANGPHGASHYVGSEGKTPGTLLAVHQGGIYEIEHSPDPVDRATHPTGVIGDYLLNRVGWMGLPRFSPNKNHVIYMAGIPGDTELYLAPYNQSTNTIGPTEYNVTNSPGSVNGQYDWGDWSPDGSEIVFESNRGGGVFHIYKADIDVTSGVLSNTVRLGPGRKPTWVQMGR